MERNAMLVCQHIVFEIWPKHRLKIYTKELFSFVFAWGTALYVDAVNVPLVTIMSYGRSTMQTVFCWANQTGVPKALNLGLKGLLCKTQG